MGGNSRPRGAIAFGLFSLFWGLQIATGNLGLLTVSTQLATLLHLTFVAFALPTTYLLVEFAVTQLGASASHVGWRFARFSTLGLAALGAILLVIFPEAIYKGPLVLADRILPNWGDAYPFLIVGPHFAAFAVAIIALHRASSAATTPRTSRRISTLLMGLGLYTSFAAGNNLTFYAITAGTFPTPRVLSFVILFLALTIVITWVIVAHVRAARTSRGGDERAGHRLVVGLFAVPLVMGGIEGAIALELLPRLETVGLWRLAGVGVIAYGLARWRVYDLADRARRVAANAGGTAVAAASGAAAYGAATVASGSPPIAAVLAVLGVAAALLPGIRFARRLFGVRALESEEAREIMYGKRIDSYRAALESSIARGTLDEDETFLAALRNRFQISDAEHRVLLHYARSSVIVARSSHAWEAYERLRLLGEGGGGRTWLARDRSRDRLVVLKEPLQRWQMEPGAREAVLREARLAARVRHPNVVHIEEVVEGKGSPVIVMEYLEGGTVRDLFDSRGPLPWSEAVVLVREVLAGVSAVHAAGIIHRDIKPSNILLTGDGVPKIADFGVAVPGSADDKTQVMGTGTVAGTMSYMAPEVREGAAAGRGADLYAVAVVLYECVYGVVPGRGVPAISDHELPPALVAVLARGMAERPEARYPSARAFADDLARLSA